MKLFKRRDPAKLLTIVPDDNAWTPLTKNIHLRNLYNTPQSVSANLLFLPRSRVLIQQLPDVACEIEILLMSGCLSLEKTPLQSPDFCLLTQSDGRWQLESESGAQCFIRAQYSEFHQDLAQQDFSLIDLLVEID
ncbi:MAG: hypothetical protein K2Y28_04370 [Burkholderiaceae bacterium]|nr:hypothetical protein [Burkholderiaceae bacterium]